MYRSLSAAAFVGLVEAAATLVCAGVTALHNLLLPASLALCYLSCSDDAAGLLDALLQPKFQTLAKRSPTYMLGKLAAVTSIITDVLSKGGQDTANWLNNGHSLTTGNAAGGNHTARLVLALATCAVTCGSEIAGIQMRRELLRLVEGMRPVLRASLPRDCLNMLVRLEKDAARSGSRISNCPLTTEAIGSALKIALTAMGDSLQRLRRRSTSAPRGAMRWASNLPVIEVETHIGAVNAFTLQGLGAPPRQSADSTHSKAAGHDAGEAAVKESAESVAVSQPMPATADAATSAAETEDEVEGDGAELQAAAAPTVEALRIQADEAVQQLPTVVKAGVLKWLRVARTSLMSGWTREEVLCRNARRAFERCGSLDSWMTYVIVKSLASLQVCTRPFHHANTMNDKCFLHDQ